MAPTAALHVLNMAFFLERTSAVALLTPTRVADIVHRIEEDQRGVHTPQGKLWVQDRGDGDLLLAGAALLIWVFSLAGKCSKLTVGYKLVLEGIKYPVDDFEEVVHFSIWLT